MTGRTSPSATAGGGFGGDGWRPATEGLGQGSGGPLECLARGARLLREAGDSGHYLTKKPTNVDLPLILSRRVQRHIDVGYAARIVRECVRSSSRR